jgi:hypothetical protein
MVSGVAIALGNKSKSRFWQIFWFVVAFLVAAVGGIIVRGIPE